MSLSEQQLQAIREADEFASRPGPKGRTRPCHCGHPGGRPYTSLDPFRLAAGA